MRIKKLWLATIAALWCSLTVNAQEEFEVDDIFYISTSSSTVEVFEYWGEKDVVVIPSTVELHGTGSMFQEPTITIFRVTSIGESAFNGRVNLTSITIPPTVTSISDYAFYGCENLKTVINYSTLDITKGSTDNGYVGYYAEHVIDRSVDEIIDDYAFTTIDGVHFLSCYVGVDRELCLPNNYRGEKYQIGEFAFYNCNQFTSITIPKGVTGIGESAFEGCGGELTVNCNIPSGAFRRSNFDKVVIGESVTSIGEKAFEGCSNIASIICFATVPPTIEGSGAFLDVDKSIPVYVPNFEYANADGWKEFSNFRFESPTYRQGSCGYDLTWRLTYDGELFIEGTGEMEDYRFPIYDGFPSSMIYLPPWYGYVVERVTINEGVTSIGDYAFWWRSYTSITLPKSLTSIGSSAFEYSDIKTVINCSELNIQKGSSDYGYVGYYADRVINVDAVVDGYAFKTKDGVHYITGYFGNDIELVLPEDYQDDDYVIAESAFQNDEDIVSVKIPQTVGSIGKSAFAGCINLASVEMARGVMSIEEKAFENCISLSSVVIPQNMRSIGYRAFYGCSSLTSVEFKEDVKSIGSEAFYGTAWYNNQPDGVMYIGKVLYEYKGTMPANTSIEVKEGVISIFSSAFYNCSGLISITIPESVTGIEGDAFYGCENLKTVINCSELNIQRGSSEHGYVGYYADRVINVDEVVDGYAFKTIDGVHSLVYYIGDETSLVLPEDYQGDDYVIGEMAFHGNEAIVSVEIPQTVGSIGKSAFAGCINLASVEMARGVMSIEEKAFENCISLSSVVIPQNMRSIGYRAFYGCSSLTSVEFKEDVKSIGSEAFYGTAWYNNQPDGVMYMGKMLYEYKGTMPANTSIEVKEGVISISGSAFYNCSGLISITIPESVTSISDDAFYGCENLNMVINFSDYFTIEKGSRNNGYVGYYADRVINVDEVVDGYAFNGNELVAYFGNDTELVLPNDYHGEAYRIGEYAFYGRSNLTSITIPASVTSIGYEAFYGCENLNMVINFSDYFTIEKGSSNNGYVGNYADRVVNADEIIDGYMFKTIDGVHSLVYYIGDETSLVLPEDYQDDDYVIAESAFQGNEDIVSVEIPQTVGAIGKSAFADCANLASVEIARGVMNIEEKAFENCISLSSVVTPQNMRSIGNSAFAGCSSLASVVFKEGVKSIGNNAFENCTVLTEIVIPESLTAIGAGAFKNCCGVASIIVGKEVESIGEGAFEGCTAVKTLIVRGSVMPTIPSSALTTIVLYSPTPLETEEFANKVYRNATLYVRNGSLARYQSADVWENFWTIKEFDHMQEAITLNQTEVTLTEGESITLTATVTLEFMSEMAVTWSTSDASVAIVDEYGAVTAVAEGTVTITAMVDGMTATCEITVFGDTTDIEKSEIRNQNPEIIYDLQGRRVLNVENIKAGIYIVNGKKVLIR